MTAIVARPRRLAPRHLWVLAGLAVGIYAGVVAGQAGVGIVPLLVFGIAPHLTVLIGIDQPHGKGQLGPRAIPFFNALHHPVPPLVLIGLGAAGLVGTFWFVGALAWLGHIVVDLGLGDGLRAADGRRRGSRGAP